MTSRQPYLILEITESDQLCRNRTGNGNWDIWQCTVCDRLCWTFAQVNIIAVEYRECSSVNRSAEINATITIAGIAIIIRHYCHKIHLSYITSEFRFFGYFENKYRVWINLCRIGSVEKCIGSAGNISGVSYIMYYIVFIQFFTSIIWVCDSFVRWTPCNCNIQTLLNK